MGHLIGKGRYARSTYPTFNRGSVNPYSQWDLLIPQMFGAVGDGVTDDTAAMQAFLDATRVQRRKGRIPGAEYLITAPLYSHDPSGERVYGAPIVGDGTATSRLIWGGPIGNGEAMLTWSRRESELAGISFYGGTTFAELRASHALVVQDAHGGRIHVGVQHTLSHGIVCNGLWQGLPSGFNHEVLFDHCRADWCGRHEIQGIRLQGDGLGGTFTLTFDGNTTAPIAVGASTATVSAALLAANPGMAPMTVAQGGTGNNPFQVLGVPGAWNVRFFGKGIDNHPLMTIDTSGVTGTITLAEVIQVQEGSRGDGIRMLSVPDGGIEWGATTFFEPMIRGNVGNGIVLRGQGQKLWGGHSESNADAGIHFDSITDPGGFSQDQMVHWPWLEGNFSGGITARTAVRSWVSIGSGFQGMTNVENADLAQFTPRNAVYRVIQRGATGYQLQLGATNDPRVIGMTQDGTIKPTRVDGIHDFQSVINHAADGPLSVSAAGVNNFRITLNGNITQLTVADAVVMQLLVFTFITTAAGAKTVTWPGIARWAGGTPPVIGAGGAGTMDVICLARHGAQLIEQYRSLQIPV